MTNTSFKKELEALIYDASLRDLGLSEEEIETNKLEFSIWEEEINNLENQLNILEEKVESTC